MIDQIIQADMILPNGTAITVSEASHPDLFWAVRGAGHNFGLVTNFKYKIYDVDPKHTWSWEFLFFRHDQLEAVFSLAKELSPTHHTNLVDFIFWMSIPEMDPAHVSFHKAADRTLAKDNSQLRSSLLFTMDRRRGSPTM